MELESVIILTAVALDLMGYVVVYNLWQRRERVRHMNRRLQGRGQ